MMDADTSLGGGRRHFPETTLGLLSRLGKDPRAGLEELARRYWKPVYRYLRMVRAKSNDDAKDLVQAFFLWLTDGDALQKYEPERGSFRGYLKVLLNRFGEHQQRAMNALKRGGGTRFVPLDDDSTLKEDIADDRADTPEAAFDREWLNALARLAVRRARERAAAEGRSDLFAVYDAYELAEGEQPTYAAVAARLGLTETEVRHALADARASVRSELRAELARLTSNDRELEDEWRALFGP